MYKKLFFICILSLFFKSCKTVVVDAKNSTITQRPVSLLCIGDEEDLLLESNYANNAIVAVNKPVKVIVTTNHFTKKTHKAYTNANSIQSKNINVEYSDSLEKKPIYLSISIADKVSVLDALKEKQNQSLKEYLSLQDNAKLITKISLVVKTVDIEKMQQAEEVFLAPYGLKSYALNLYSKGEIIHRVLFTDTVVFAYNSSGICWKENNKHQLEIVDLVGGNGCPVKTFKSANRAKKKINYFKL
ncbi:hypothetical protein [Pseudofulvibacter geojedonensis]|uniref:Lipoprotein n=1 Tax=Pseudofulvibacter geojedonensis TaxID=1123758 RepID=A0ABW3I2E5_9FLAO